MDQQKPRTGISLLFSADERPTVQDIDAIVRRDEALSGVGAVIGHRPDESEGWVELLVSGLTFELHGLAPAAPMPVTSATHAVGFDIAAPSTLEAVALVAGPHLAAGSAMIPVVRAITGLAANLALSTPVKAMVWEPAQSWMEPRYFARSIISWLAGGAFPVPGLVAIVPGEDGVTSAGLAFFSAQEVRVATTPGEALSDTIRQAIRLIDTIVRGGPITTRVELDPSSGASLIAEPSADGRLVNVWHGR